MQFFVVALFRLTFTINFVVVLLVESLAIEFIYLNVGQLKLIVVTVLFAFFFFLMQVQSILVCTFLIQSNLRYEKLNKS